jgi:hypothetical protein
MTCHEPLCQLNDALLGLLPMLEAEQQRHVLQRWGELDLAGRAALLRLVGEPDTSEADLATLSRLAEYFQCGVYDVMRYTRPER